MSSETQSLEYVEAAIHNRLIADDLIRSETDNGAGADLRYRVFPDEGEQDADLPLVVSSLTTDPVDGTFAEDSVDSEFDIDIYTPRATGKARARRLAEKVFRLFHKKHVPIAGYSVMQTVCTNRGLVQIEEDAYRVVMTFRAWASS